MVKHEISENKKFAEKVIRAAKSVKLGNCGERSDRKHKPHVQAKIEYRGKYEGCQKGYEIHGRGAHQRF